MLADLSRLTQADLRRPATRADADALRLSRADADLLLGAGHTVWVGVGLAVTASMVDREAYGRRGRGVDGSPLVAVPTGLRRMWAIVDLDGESEEMHCKTRREALAWLHAAEVRRACDALPAA